jgi:hypothetical protein
MGKLGSLEKVRVIDRRYRRRLARSITGRVGGIIGHGDDFDFNMSVFR